MIVFVDKRQCTHLIVGAVSLWTRHPALHLMCRALKRSLSSATHPDLSAVWIITRSCTKAGTTSPHRRSAPVESPESSAQQKAAHDASHQQNQPCT